MNSTRPISVNACVHEGTQRAARRQLLLATALAGLGAMTGGPVLHAQARYPSRPVRLVVPFAAGTSPDVIARLWGERFSKLAGQPVVVENKPGAGTIVAAQSVATASADGHTLFWTVSNTFSINPFIYKKLPYNSDDFVPISLVLSVPFVLVVSAESKLRNLNDLIGAAKSAPGTLSYASPGIGTVPHIAMVRFLNAAGVTMNHVPYKDYFLPDVIAQRVDVAFDASATAIGQIKGGKVRALGVSSAARVEALQDVAPIAESFPGFVGNSWYGVFAPKATADDIVDTIGQHSQAIVGSAEFRQTLTGYGLVPVGGSPSSFRQFLPEDARAWSQVIRNNQIALD
ncbi:Bug family tripartite tricarboxylate transporter substrate binding protein [Methylibium sp.]|uniref:Bug family tripartite tricarboxylate transporter substrate binding protein n=1 Tax=Methylibium sp. TaxID=2067992 RepID=UPI003D0DE2CE